MRFVLEESTVPFLVHWYVSVNMSLASQDKKKEEPTNTWTSAGLSVIVGRRDPVESQPDYIVHAMVYQRL